MVNVTHPLQFTLVGGPTAVLVYGGVRFITDPTFDPPGSYEPRPGVTLTKTAGPALSPDEVGEVHVVLLSHDHHKDNLDDSGRDFLARASRVLTTTSGAERLGAGATALPNWTSIEIDRAGAGPIKVTGLPAQHGQDGSGHLVGEVTGFSSDRREPALGVRQRGQRLVGCRADDRRSPRHDRHSRAVRGRCSDAVPGRRTSHAVEHDAAQAAQLLGVHAVVALHYADWTHFSEGL